MSVSLDSARVSWPEIGAARGLIALLPVGASGAIGMLAS